LSAAADRLRAHDLDAIKEAVVKAVQFKARVVVADEREGGSRACLNYGHTFAHALEAATDYSISHGRAVAEGMRFAARLAVEAADAPAAFVQQQDALLDALGLAPLAAAYSADELYEQMLSDKKAQAGRLRFVFAQAPGLWQLTEVDPDLLKIYLLYWQQAQEAK